MTDIEKAYNVAAAAVAIRWAKEHPARLATLGSIRKSEVAVLSGSYDHVQNVLKRIGVSHQMDPTHLNTAIVFANCGMGHHPACVERARAFVEAGGHLVSSDWAMAELVAPAFPNTIGRHGTRNTGTEVVGVEAANESLWSEVVVPGCEPQWRVEGSHPIEILDPDRVTIEAASHELMCRYGRAPIAVRFPWEQGQVFHVISHFWLMGSRAPSADHRGPAADFLRRGMRLTDDEITDVFVQAKVAPEALSFAAAQTAVTATELVARLCVDAVLAKRATAQRPSWMQRVLRRVS